MCFLYCNSQRAGEQGIFAICTKKDAIGSAIFWGAVVLGQGYGPCLGKAAPDGDPVIPMSRGGFRQTKKMRCNVWLWEGGGVCGGTVGSYRTLSEHSEWITRPQAAPNKNSLKSFDPKPFYDEVPMVGLEPTWFPERF